ncbi:hypothetical protein KIPB_004989, partial [Kipferlia bialata]
LPPAPHALLQRGVATQVECLAADSRGGLVRHQIGKSVNSRAILADTKDKALSPVLSLATMIVAKTPTLLPWGGLTMGQETVAMGMLLAVSKLHEVLVLSMQQGRGEKMLANIPRPIKKAEGEGEGEGERAEPASTSCSVAWRPNTKPLHEQHSGSQTLAVSWGDSIRVYALLQNSGMASPDAERPAQMQVVEMDSFSLPRTPGLDKDRECLVGVAWAGPQYIVGVVRDSRSEHGDRLIVVPFDPTGRRARESRREREREARRLQGEVSLTVDGPNVVSFSLSRHGSEKETVLDTDGRLYVQTTLKGSVVGRDVRVSNGEVRQVVVSHAQIETDPLSGDVFVLTENSHTTSMDPSREGGANGVYRVKILPARQVGEDLIRNASNQSSKLAPALQLLADSLPTSSSDLRQHAVRMASYHLHTIMANPDLEDMEIGGPRPTYRAVASVVTAAYCLAGNYQTISGWAQDMLPTLEALSPTLRHRIYVAMSQLVLHLTRTHGEGMESDPHALMARGLYAEDICGSVADCALGMGHVKLALSLAVHPGCDPMTDLLRVSRLAMGMSPIPSQAITMFYGHALSNRVITPLRVEESASSTVVSQGGGGAEFSQSLSAPARILVPHVLYRVLFSPPPGAPNMPLSPTSTSYNKALFRWIDTDPSVLRTLVAPFLRGDALPSASIAPRVGPAPETQAMQQICGVLEPSLVGKGLGVSEATLKAVVCFVVERLCQSVHSDVYSQKWNVLMSPAAWAVLLLVLLRAPLHTVHQQGLDLVLSDKALSERGQGVLVSPELILRIPLVQDILTKSGADAEGESERQTFEEHLVRLLGTRSMVSCRPIVDLDLRQLARVASAGGMQIASSMLDMKRGMQIVSSMLEVMDSGNSVGAGPSAISPPLGSPVAPPSAVLSRSVLAKLLRVGEKERDRKGGKRDRGRSAKERERERERELEGEVVVRPADMAVQYVKVLLEADYDDGTGSKPRSGLVRHIEASSRLEELLETHLDHLLLDSTPGIAAELLLKMYRYNPAFAVSVLSERQDLWPVLVLFVVAVVEPSLLVSGTDARCAEDLAKAGRSLRSGVKEALASYSAHTDRDLQLRRRKEIETRVANYLDAHPFAYLAYRLHSADTVDGAVVVTPGAKVRQCLQAVRTGEVNMEGNVTQWIGVETLGSMYCAMVRHRPTYAASLCQSLLGFIPSDTAVVQMVDRGMGELRRLDTASEAKREDTQEAKVSAALRRTLVFEAVLHLALSDSRALGTGDTERDSVLPPEKTFALLRDSSEADLVYLDLALEGMPPAAVESGVAVVDTYAVKTVTTRIGMYTHYLNTRVQRHLRRTEGGKDIYKVTVDPGQRALEAAYEALLVVFSSSIVFCSIYYMF